MAYQATINDDVFDKLRFVNEIGTQILSQLGEGVRAPVWGESEYQMFHSVSTNCEL